MDASTNYHYEEENLSEEDLELKQQVESYVERVQDPDPGVQRVALQSMRQEIRSAITNSITSVQKPLNFLRPHYGTLKAYYESMPESDLKTSVADILSVLALTMSSEGGRPESVKYRLLGSKGDIGSWGHEYVRILSIDICQDYEERKSEDLKDIVRDIVDFHMEHNAEPKAVDLLLKLEDLNLLLEYEKNYKRSCQYLIALAKNLAHPEDVAPFEIALRMYKEMEEFASALEVSLYLHNLQSVKQIFTSCKDILQKKQFCYIFARHGVFFELDYDMVMDDKDREQLEGIINNSMLSENYLTIARAVEVMEAKSPEDIYGACLLDGRSGTCATINSALQNLAATFVHAFVNAGFGQDKLMISPTYSSSGGSFEEWLFKNAAHRKTSTAASLGMISMWDVHSGPAQLQEYINSTDHHVTAGALLGVGIASCRIKDDSNSVYHLLRNHIGKNDAAIQIGAIMGLGIAYANTQNRQICNALTGILISRQASLEVNAFVAISLGLVYVGSCDKDAAWPIIDTLTSLRDCDLGDPLARLVPLGLGLLYLGKQERVNETKKVSESLDENIRKHCNIVLHSCAYAGTGNDLQVESLYAHCGQHLEEGETYHGPAVLGIAMVAMAKKMGLEMAIRLLQLMLNREQSIRRAVPLALGLLCISNPKVNVMDTLSKLSHDSDREVVMAAIISMGLIAAGTNNAQIVATLRELSIFYCNDDSALFCVRIAQGLTHLGKGLLTLDPYHSDRFLLSPIALAGLVTVLHACLDMNTLILGNYHYMLYFLVLVMQPRMLMTVDENLKPLSVLVRVGQAVDAGEAGQPKTITRSQTHSTPVILSAGDRAELATDKYIPLAPILEGFVILKENPEYKEKH